MTLESRIEARAVKELARIGTIAIKAGRDGWPDRVVFYAPNRALLMEFKVPGKGPSKIQKVRIAELGDIDQDVHIVTSWQQALDLVEDARCVS